MNKTIKIIDLINMIARGKIEDKRTFNIVFPNKIHRSIYYDANEPNCLHRLKNVSDDEPIYDDIEFNDEVEIIDEEPEEKLTELQEYDYSGVPKWTSSELVIVKTLNKIIRKLKEE